MSSFSVVLFRPTNLRINVGLTRGQTGACRQPACVHSTNDVYFRTDAFDYFIEVT